MKSLYLAAGLALIAVPANAAGTPAQSGAAAVKAAKSTQAAKGAAAKETKYCLTYDKTVGSRLNKTECKTRAEWAKEDVDVDQLAKS